jgi:hypothetical protein
MHRTSLKHQLGMGMRGHWSTLMPGNTGQIFGHSARLPPLGFCEKASTIDGLRTNPLSQAINNGSDTIKKIYRAWAHQKNNDFA